MKQKDEGVPVYYLVITMIIFLGGLFLGYIIPSEEAEIEEPKFKNSHFPPIKCFTSTIMNLKTGVTYTTGCYYSPTGLMGENICEQVVDKPVFEPAGTIDPYGNIRDVQIKLGGY